jgi:hypothetical protein
MVLITEEVHDRRLETSSSPETAGEVGDPQQIRFHGMIVGKMIGVTSLPDQMAGAAEERDEIRVEEPPIVRPMMCVSARRAANKAPTVVTPINVLPHPLPLFRC